MLFKLSQMYVHINKHGGINKVDICFLLSNKLCPDHHGLQIKKKKMSFCYKTLKHFGSKQLSCVLVFYPLRFRAV